MSLTTDKNHPGVNKPKGEGEQNEAYLILSEEERAKGFIRPVRTDYVHVGKNIKKHWKSIHRILTKEEQEEHKDKKYVAIMTVLTKEDGSFLGGAYVTQEELSAWENGAYLDGCGTRTTMDREIAETYARNPLYYGATWCMGCRKHIDVGEFVWDGTNEIVGS